MKRASSIDDSAPVVLMHNGEDCTEFVKNSFRHWLKESRSCYFKKLDQIIQAIALINNGGRTRAEVSRHVGIPAKTIASYQKRYHKYVAEYKPLLNDDKSEGGEWLEETKEESEEQEPEAERTGEADDIEGLESVAKKESGSESPHKVSSVAATPSTLSSTVGKRKANDDDEKSLRIESESQPTEEEVPKKKARTENAQTVEDKENMQMQAMVPAPRRRGRPRKSVAQNDQQPVCLQQPQETLEQRVDAVMSNVLHWVPVHRKAIVHENLHNLIFHSGKGFEDLSAYEQCEARTYLKSITPMLERTFDVEFF